MASDSSMLNFDPFQDTPEQEAQSVPIDPVWSLDEFSKSRTSVATQEELLAWLDKAYTGIQEASIERTNTQIKNLALYKGIHYWSQDRNSDFRSDTGVEVDTQKIVSNELHELTETRVSKLSRFKPTTVPVPATNEQKDKAGTDVVKAVLETIGYENDKDHLMQRISRYTHIFGAQPLLITWNPDKGLRGKGGKAVGDIEYKLILPWQLVLDPQRNYEEVEWMIYAHYEHIEKVKFDNPDMDHDLLKADKAAVYFDVADLGCRQLPNHVMIFDFYHRNNKYLPKGLYFQCTPAVMTKLPVDNPYPDQPASRFGNLPIEMLDDIEIPGQLYAMSSYQILSNFNHTINKLYTMANRNLMLMGHPKFMVPSQANVKFEDLGNDATIVEYNGPQPPQLVTAGTINPEVFAFLERLEGKMQALGGVHPVSTGEPPPGIKAGIAIRLLEDLENQRATTTVKKYNKMIIDIDRKTLAVVGKYYKNSEKRMINILGRDKGYLRDTFDATVLNGSYDIRIQQGSSLPQTPAARVQTVIDLMQIPGMKELHSNEEWADMLDLAAPGKFYDASKAAVHVAEWENEEYASGRVPPEPRPGEHLEVHWRIHSTFYQTRGFMELDEAIQEEFKLHLNGTEMLMWLHAQQNPTFAQKLLTLPNWPMLFIQPQQALAPQTQAPGANTGMPMPEMASTEPAPEAALMPQGQMTNQQVAGGKANA